MITPTPTPTSNTTPRPLCGCHCCGLIQTLPETIPTDQIAVCQRCGSTLNYRRQGRNRWTVALALSALAFYLPAVSLPMLRLERLGHVSESSLLAGINTLWQQGYWHIGLIVLLFSVVLPPLKLFALSLLCSNRVIERHHHKAYIYHLVEFLGRWSMLDIMLVALLVAFVKLGDLVNIQAESGAIAFAIMVLLSLCASLVFNPTLMWESES